MCWALGQRFSYLIPIATLRDWYYYLLLHMWGNWGSQRSNDLAKWQSQAAQFLSPTLGILQPSFCEPPGQQGPSPYHTASGTCSGAVEAAAGVILGLVWCEWLNILQEFWLAPMTIRQGPPASRLLTFHASHPNYARSLDHSVSIKTLLELAMTFTSIRLFKICKAAVHRNALPNTQPWNMSRFIFPNYSIFTKSLGHDFLCLKNIERGAKFFNFLSKLLKHVKRRFLQMNWFPWLKRNPSSREDTEKRMIWKNLGEGRLFGFLTCASDILLFSYLIVLRMLNQTWLQWCLCVKMTKAMG